MFEGIKIREILHDKIRGCEICQHNNPCNQHLLPLLELKGKASILERTGKLISPHAKESSFPFDSSTNGQLYRVG
jgi:hypothetical protein